MTWCPARRVFLRRALINAALTLVVSLAILLALVTYWQTTPLVAIGLAVIATFAGLFEDLMRWRRVRHETWQLEPPHLVHDGPDGRAMVALSEIAQIRPRGGHSLILHLKTGQRLVLAYLEQPDHIATALTPAAPPPPRDAQS